MKKQQNPNKPLMLFPKKRESEFQLPKSENSRGGDIFICETDTQTLSVSPYEIVVHVSNGHIPLWAKNQELHWSFDEYALRNHQHPQEFTSYVRKLMHEALLAWGDAAPITFIETKDLVDFQIQIAPGDNCGHKGCVLAKAFFPNSLQNKLIVFPKLFEQPRQEQLETLMHELGHIFGLRHYFAQISDRILPSVIFGEHKAFSIMNYGNKSILTKEDKRDLKLLYQKAWNRELTSINNTPIYLVKPFHTAVGT